MSLVDNNVDGDADNRCRASEVSEQSKDSIVHFWCIYGIWSARATEFAVIKKRPKPLK